MALAGQRVKIQQVGDAVVGEQVDYVLDKEAGVIGQKKTVVAHDPEGGMTVVMTEHVAISGLPDAAPGYTARSNYAQRPALSANSYNVSGDPSEENADRTREHLKSCGWLTCGCCSCLVSLAMIIPIAVVGLATCSPLEGTGITGIILGIVTFLISCLCCSRCFELVSQNRCSIQCAFCSVVFVLLLTFISVLIANTILVAQNIDIIYTDICASSVASVAVMGMSYVMLLLFIAFCLCSTYKCWNSFDSEFL